MDVSADVDNLFVFNLSCLVAFVWGKKDTEGNVYSYCIPAWASVL